MKKRKEHGCKHDKKLKKTSTSESKKAVEDLAALSVKLPPWEETEEEIEKHRGD